MDHINNARWLLVHIYDLHNLPSKIEDEFIKGSWVVSRSQRSFSSIPIDQCHEQLNKHINGVGGAVGLMNDPAADKAQGLLVFHAITGSDTASAFANKGKLSSWKAWSAVTETGNLTLHLMYQIKSIVKAICRLCDKQNTKFVPVGYQMQCILIPFPLVICGLR
ncbi:hypothetical protein GQR58_000809 [Nymphon striatum]|nr:hypothetical protein GQR58_000809 [Nymphon striatum]